MDIPSIMCRLLSSCLRSILRFSAADSNRNLRFAQIYDGSDPILRIEGISAVHRYTKQENGNASLFTLGKCHWGCFDDDLLVGEAERDLELLELEDA